MTKKGKVRKSDKELDENAIMEEKISIFVAIGLTLLFVVIGIFLGYCLYKLSLSSSGTILINKYLYK
ncbi:MAG: hypothetical protein IKF19_01345 [Bacilli bacterium]|nr:hypothetical protein [Bacilli bacterium]